MTLEGTADELSNLPLDLGNPQFEVTQAIQTPQNDLDLVAGKPAGIRIWSSVPSDASESYIYGQRGGVDLPGSPIHKFFYLSKYNDEANSRDTSGRITTLPESWSSGGSVDFDVLLRDRDGSAATALSSNVDFVPTGTPVFWTVPIRNNFPNAPSVVATNAQITAHEQALLNDAPLDEIDIVRRPIYDVQNISTSASLKTQLKTYDQQVLLAWTLGLLLTGEPPFNLPEQITGFIPQAIGGIGGSSDRIGKGGQGRITWVNSTNNPAGKTYMHELNHNLDAAATSTWGVHSGGCNAANGGLLDGSWPYGTFRIQEVGAIWRGTSFASVSDQTWDFMSYCSSSAAPWRWWTPYRWNAWLDLFRTDTLLLSTRSLSTLSSVAATSSIAPVNSFYILGLVYPDGSGELGQVLRQPGLLTMGRPGAPYSVNVLDCGGVVLARHEFSAAFVGETLDRRELSANAPSVNILTPNGGEVWAADALVSWQASDADGDPLAFTLLYSPDDGMTWQPLATGIQGNEYLVDATQLPGSDHARLRVLASDGANTSQDDSDVAFSVATKPPRVTIVAPLDGQLIEPGRELTLRGSAQDVLGGRLPDDGLYWDIDGEVVGAGAAVRAFLDEGEHVVTLLYLADGTPIGADSITILVTSSDANDDGILAGGYRLGENGNCDVADITLRYRHTDNGNSCVGLPGLTCSIQEIGIAETSDAICDGVVDGRPAATCRVIISAPVSTIAAERAAQCADPDDNCLGGSGASFDAYAYFRTQYRRYRDRAPDTAGGEPARVEEVLRVPVVP